MMGIEKPEALARFAIVTVIDGADDNRCTHRSVKAYSKDPPHDYIATVTADSLAQK